MKKPLYILSGAPRDDEDELYDSIEIAHDTRWDLLLPTREDTLAYLREVRDRVLEALSAPDVPETSRRSHRPRPNHCRSPCYREVLPSKVTTVSAQPRYSAGSTASTMSVV